MHLKTLTLRGFKSFASATTLHFEPGITCVVGPNGSGKSNVVDALAWVMGEQGAKSLRGGSMADVIFAGTTTRPALGRAEVSLTIDNTDGLLPIDYTEVTLTRTMFRSGGSDYAINGESCRLLDIQELLSDSGMGREMHVVVGQGQLDAILSADPHERRGFIEEAAGILKHRRRKDKALRKLEAMRANVERVTDLTTELRRQLGPLAKQAEVARRAQVIQAECHDARARLLADDLVQLRARLAAEQADEEALRQRREQLEAELATARSHLAQHEQHASAEARQLRQTTETWHELTSLRERLRGLHSLAAERCRLLAVPDTEPSGSDPAKLEAQADEARLEHDELQQACDVARHRLAEAASARSEAEQAEEQAATHLAAIQRGAAEGREEVATLSGKVAACRSALEANGDEVGRLRSGLAAAQQRATEAQAEFTTLEQQAAGDEEGEEGLDAAYETALAEQHEAAQALAEVQAQGREADSQRNTWHTRRETLALALRGKDGNHELLAARAELAGVIGALPDELSIEVGYEAAIATALGTYADAAVVGGPDVASEALHRTRHDDLGQLRLLLATEAKQGPESETSHPPAPAGGRWAAEVITAEGQVRHTVDHLLTGVVIVTDLAAARRVLQEDPAAVAVTTDGDLLSLTHANGGGSTEPSVLELHAARDEAAAELDRTTRRCEELRFAIQAATERSEQATQRVQDTLADLHSSDARLAGTAERLGHLGSVVRSATAEAQRADAAIEEALATGQRYTAELADLEQRLQAAEQQPAHNEEEEQAAAEAREAAGERARNARGTETEARLALRTAEERAEALASRVASLQQAASTEREARQRAHQRQARRRHQAHVAAEVREEAERALQVLTVSLTAAAEARDRGEGARASTEAELTRLRSTEADTSAELSRLTDEVHRDDVARAEQRLRLEALEEQALSEIGLQAQELETEYGPDQPVPQPASDDDTHPPPLPFVRAEQEKRLKRAERDLERLGKVNPLALEEHAALAERHRFLNEQLADLTKSRDDLLQIVAEIDERVEHVFTEAYKDTAEAFREVFARLFPGGEGRLELTEPDNMLSTGVDIQARPAGKKVSRLSLLSGGERSLTAVALLIAIFKARPSPFYVLDEVEAALDDANLGRLLEIFTELRDSSQLIVITHQKRTMEVADALYGATMADDGITTLISQRLGEEAAASDG